MVRIFDWFLVGAKFGLPLLLWSLAMLAFAQDCGWAQPQDVAGRFWPLFHMFADFGYRAAQLFVFEFDRGCSYGDDPAGDLPGGMNLIRFVILVYVLAAVASFLVPRFRRWLLVLLHVVFGHLLRGGRSQRVIVLGYGSVGQAVAHELSAGRGRLVTVVHKGLTSAMREQAGKDNIVLVEGDPSDPDILRRARPRLSRRIFVALDDDMKTLDAAVAASAARKEGLPEIHVMLRDPDLARHLPEGAPAGFLGAPDIQAFSLSHEAARLLVAEARFDRAAVESGQDRVHVVVLGCGAQGEAVAIETLLASWRVKLGPPRVSIYDRNVGPVRARFVRRAPTLFETGANALYPDARAQVEFGAIDLETVDFATDPAIEALLDGAPPVTAWVFAAGDDSLNVRAAAMLHQAMLRGRLPAAPIHVRIWQGHEGDTPVLSSNPLAVVRPFGALERTLAESPSCDHDPDVTAKALHCAYAAQGKAMFGREDTPWELLSPTMRSSNRRLHRHAAMKFDDLGGQWRRPRARPVPVVEKALRDSYVEIENALDYGKHSGRMLAEDEWWNDRKPASNDALTRMRAQKLLSTAFAEHNRWTVDRALDGWRRTPLPDKTLRDDRARLHHCMHPWETLEPETRRYDAVLLRALVAGGAEEERSLTAWRRKEHRLVLVIGEAATDPKTNAPVVSPPQSPQCRLLPDEEIPEGVTELQVAVRGDMSGTDLDAACEGARAAFAALLLRRGVLKRLCRVRFDFPDMPSTGALAVANAMASMIAKPPLPGWARRHLAVGRRLSVVEKAALRLVDVEGIEVSAHWPLAASVRAGPEAQVYGIVGHRVLDGLGGADGLHEYFQAFFARRLAAGTLSGIVSGYAPGVDRAAVNAWLSLAAGRPLLLFPYGTDLDGNPPKDGGEPALWWTDAPDRALPGDRIEAAAISGLASCTLAGRRPGMDRHEAQALDLLDASQVLVAVYDGRGNRGAGGTFDTIAKARERGMKVIVVSRDGKGEPWRNDDPDDPENRPPDAAADG